MSGWTAWWVLSFAAACLLSEFQVGGLTEGIASQKRPDTHVEPVFLKSTPRYFYKALLHGYFVKRVIDTSPGKGAFAEACLQTRTGYFAFAFTEKHRDDLMGRLKYFVMDEMCKEDSVHYEAKCAEALAPQNPDGGSGGNRKPTPERRAEQGR